MLFELKLYLYNNILTHFPSHCVRMFYLKNIMHMKIGKSCFVHMGARFEGDIIIGNNTVIGRNCVLIGNISIGNNVSITAETYMFSYTHDKNSQTFECINKPITINDYVWIGARAMILPGVDIGSCAILGAASTATKNIPNNCVFAGCPARYISTRDNVKYNLSYSPYFQ